MTKYLFTRWWHPSLQGVLVDPHPAIIDSLTMVDGRSQRMLFDVMRTGDEFIWFGTKDGLNRNDGVRLK